MCACRSEPVLFLRAMLLRSALQHRLVCCVLCASDVVLMWFVVLDPLHQGARARSSLLRLEEEKTPHVSAPAATLYVLPASLYHRRQSSLRVPRLPVLLGHALKQRGMRSCAVTAHCESQTTLLLTSSLVKLQASSKHQDVYQGLPRRTTSP